MAAPAVDATAYAKQAAEEVVAIVDDENKVVGKARRADMRAKRLCHRSTFIFLRNSRGQFYVQKRTLLKDYCPGYYDPCSGGVVQYGEDSHESAQRELEEEMGVHGVKVEHCFDAHYTDDVVDTWALVYDAMYDGDVKMQPEEVEAVELWTKEEVLRKAEEGVKFTPDGLAMFKRYCEHRGL